MVGITYINATAKIDNITISKGAVVSTNISGYCSNVIVMSCGTLIVSNYASALNVTSNPGAIIQVASSGFIN